MKLLFCSGMYKAKSESSTIKLIVFLRLFLSLLYLFSKQKTKFLILLITNGSEEGISIEATLESHSTVHSGSLSS